MITVRYFASLREQMGFSEQQVPFVALESVEQLIARIGESEPGGENLLAHTDTQCAVNLKQVDRSERLQDGDEVAFFPPVTGG